MEQNFEPIILHTRETPVQILSEDFPKHEWPISGGWGYTQEDAVVIETEDGSKGVPLEYKFLEYRTYEEMIIFQPRDAGYAGFRFERGMQSLCSSKDGSKHYDYITMKVTCFKLEDWEMLKKDYVDHDGYANDEEGYKAHMQWHESKKISFEVEGWFDITKFYGNY